MHLHDVTIIKNENLGLTVWKLNDEDVCFLEDLDPETQPSRFVLEVAYLEAHNVTVHTEDIRTVNLQSVDDGVWEGDRDTLTEDMARLCEDLPIRKIHNVKMGHTKVHMRKRQANTRGWCVVCWIRPRSIGPSSEIVHKIVHMGN